jgi:hypothetical protein
MKTLFLLISLIFIASADEATITKYNVKLSLFGTVGQAKITIATKDDKYMMMLESAATGLAADISKNEKDRFISRGHIQDGFYISDTFEEYQVNDTTVETNLFVFDHINQSITRFQDKNETVVEESFNPIKMGFDRKKYQKIKKEETKLEYYSHYDALSVILNLHTFLSNNKQYEIKPVGLAKEGRRMEISRPTKSELPDMLEMFNYPEVEDVIILDSFEIDSDDEYGVLIGFDKDGNIDEVVTKETYFLIGYGRIEKIDMINVSPEQFFQQPNPMKF